MALIDSIEKEGNLLFKYRGQIPVILFLLAIPYIFTTNYEGYSPRLIMATTLFAILISITGFLFRAYTIGTTPRGTSGRNTEEQIADVLNTSGIYSIVRHPLYVGNYLMWLGIIVFVMSPSLIIIFSLLYWIYYERIMYAEERFLERKFDEPYRIWSEKVPTFIPAFSKFIPSTIPLSIKTILKREYSGILATVFGFVYVAVLRDIKINDSFMIEIRYFYILGLTLILTLALRTLKYKGILDEKDRS